MNTYFLVGLGGALGAILRYVVGNWIFIKSGFPWPTFIVNILGALLMGLLLVWSESLDKEKVASFLLYFGVIGFCGGFTTFSTFAKELFFLLKDGQTIVFLIYVLLSVILSVIAFAISYYCFKLFFS